MSKTNPLTYLPDQRPKRVKNTLITEEPLDHEIKHMAESLNLSYNAFMNIAARYYCDAVKKKRRVG